MIIIDKVLTTNRIKSAHKELKATMESYNTYSTSLKLAKKLKDLLQEHDDVRIKLFSKYSLKSETAYNYLKASGLSHIADFIKDELPYNDDDMKLFKVLVNAEINRVKPEQIENIAFAGGGAKGMAYPGALRRMAEMDLKIKRVSGTSAGAITALPLALGYTPRKVEEIVLQYDFTRFMYHSNINKPILKDTLMTNMMHQSAYLREFKKQFNPKFLDYLIKNPSFFERVCKKYEKDYRLESKIQEEQLIEYHYEQIFLNEPNLKSKLRFLPLDSYLKDIIDEARKLAIDVYTKSLSSEKDKEFVKEMIDQMINSKNNKHGDLLVEFIRLKRNEDLIEEFFGDLIENRLHYLNTDKNYKGLLESISVGLSGSDRLRNITFKEFQQVIDKTKDDPRWNFKELAICICEKISGNPLKTFDKDNYKQIDVYAGNPDPVYSEMPIKTAVRISMNLPGAFSSYEYKGKKYVDGGVRANFPMHFFDTTLGLDRRKTIGFCLAPAENYSRTEDAGKVLNPDRRSVISQNNLLKRAIAHVSNYLSDVMTQIHGNKLDNNKPLDFFDLTRIGVINVLNIDTTTFNLNQATKRDLFKQGYFTSYDLLKEDYNAQLRHFVERMKILHTKIGNDLDLLEKISPEKKKNILSEISDEISFKDLGEKISSLQDDIHYRIGEKVNRKKLAKP